MRAFPAKFLLALVACLALSAATAQGQFAARVSMCGGMEGGAFQPPTLCGINASLEQDGYGVFVQTSPRYGPFWDNWQIYPYRPTQVVGNWVTSWPGIAVGREQGEWFIRAQADIIFVVRW